MTKIMAGLAALSLAACGASPIKPHDPTTGAASAATPHRSGFEGYRPMQADEPMKGWREANDEVREAGGHVGIMKGASHK